MCLLLPSFLVGFLFSTTDQEIELVFHGGLHFAFGHRISSHCSLFGRRRTDGRRKEKGEEQKNRPKMQILMAFVRSRPAARRPTLDLDFGFPFVRRQAFSDACL